MNTHLSGTCLGVVVQSYVGHDDLYISWSNMCNSEVVVILGYYLHLIRKFDWMLHHFPPFFHFPCILTVGSCQCDKFSLENFFTPMLSIHKCNSEKFDKYKPWTWFQRQMPWPLEKRECRLMNRSGYVGRQTTCCTCAFMSPLLRIGRGSRYEAVLCVTWQAPV